MVYVFVHHNILAHYVNIVNKLKIERKIFFFNFFYLIANPCSSQNLCLNSGTCVGQYNVNGSLYTQCFCPEGYTGIYCECNRNEKRKI